MTFAPIEMQAALGVEAVSVEHKQSASQRGCYHQWLNIRNTLLVLAEAELEVLPPASPSCNT